MIIVTVAIPVYNAEKYLEKAITSVLSQTYKDFELWLVDDGSTDSSLEICRKFLYDERVKIFADGENLGLATRLNTIAQQVETEYLVRMDNDDMMHPQRIEKQLEVLLQNPEIDVLSTNLYSIDEEDCILGKRYDVDESFLGHIFPFIHPTVMAKTIWFKDNPYDKKAIRVDDADLWMRTKDKCVFKTMGEPLLFYREIGNRYYKKYLQGFPGIFYLLKKNIFSAQYLKFCFKYVVVTFIYYIFYLFGKENILIRNRNQVKIDKTYYKDFIKLENTI